MALGDYLNFGFTGTRAGMTAAQQQSLCEYLRAMLLDRPTEGHVFHHGGASGADEQAARLADGFGFSLIVHPCMPYDGKAEKIHALLPPLVRNRIIVDSTDVLLAAPRLMREERRSGTWATIRYAERHRRATVVFWPDGTLTIKE